ncbi:MAG: hypothetical protein QG557_1076, partial [Pseudomonadota bacterium]|nr:hypothetical protein [Pseudomonadota bacterium]
MIHKHIVYYGKNFKGDLSASLVV